MIKYKRKIDYILHLIQNLHIFSDSQRGGIETIKS